MLIDPFKIAISSKFVPQVPGKPGNVGYGAVITDEHEQTYRIIVMNVPACCGAYFLMSDDVIPVNILDSILVYFRMCGKMLIFVMPNLPSSITKVTDGVGVSDWDGHHDKYTSPNLVIGKVTPPHGVKIVHQMQIAEYGANSLVRCNENTFFYHVLRQNDTVASSLKNIEKQLAKANKKCTLIFIANGGQRSGCKMLNDTEHVFKCKNAGTGSMLYLYKREINAEPAEAVEPKNDKHKMVDAAPK